MIEKHPEMNRFAAFRWIEITRRLGLLIGLIIGIWLIWNPVGEIYRIHPVDFEEAFSRMPGWQQARFDTLEAYIDNQLEGRTIETQDSFWISLYRDLDRSVTRPDAAPHARRTVISGNSAYTFFLPREIPSSVFMNEDAPFTYLEIHIDTDQKYYLGINRWVGDEVTSRSPKPPDWLLFPHRTAGLIILISGILVYILIPRIPMQKGYLYYQKGPAIVGPDLGGLILTGGFFWIGRMLLVWEGSHLWIMTIIFWALGLLGILMLMIGLWYSCLRYWIDEEGIIQYSLKGKRKVFWREMNTVSNYQKRVPAWLAGLFVWFGAYGRLSTQMAIQQGFKVGNGLRIEVEGQKPLIIMADALVGVDSLNKALYNNRSRFISSSDTVSG